MGGRKGRRRERWEREKKRIGAEMRMLWTDRWTDIYIHVCVCTCMCIYIYINKAGCRVKKQ